MFPSEWIFFFETGENAGTYRRETAQIMALTVQQGLFPELYKIRMDIYICRILEILVSGRNI